MLNKNIIILLIFVYLTSYCCRTVKLFYTDRKPTFISLYHSTTEYLPSEIKLSIPTLTRVFKRRGKGTLLFRWICIFWYTPLVDLQVGSVLSARTPAKRKREKVFYSCYYYYCNTKLIVTLHYNIALVTINNICPYE